MNKEQTAMEVLEMHFGSDFYQLEEQGHLKHILSAMIEYANQQPELPKSIEERANELYPVKKVLPSGKDMNEDKRDIYLQCAKDFRVGEFEELLNKVVKMQRSTFGDATSLHLKLAVLVKEIEQTLKQD